MAGQTLDGPLIRLYKDSMGPVPRTIFIVTMCAGLAFALVGCTTLPLPDAPDQSLVVLVYDDSRVQLPGEERILSMSVDFRHNATGVRSRMQLPTSREWGSLALDPGAYRIERLTLRIMEGNDSTRTETRPVLGRVFVTPQTVVILPRTLRLSSFDSHSFGVTFGALSYGSSSHRQATEEIYREQLWPAWSGYRKINLYEPECQ